MDETAGTGCVRVVQEEKILEWKIDDFLQLTNNTVDTDSPEFCFSDETWKMTIFPFNEGGSGYIGLDVYLMSFSEPLTVTVTTGFKTVNGKSDSEDTSTRFLVEEDDGFCRRKVISRSELIRRESELLPSGALTVICFLKKSDPNVFYGGSVLQHQFREILQNGNVSDLVLKVKGQEFKSHRFVLAARSPVFLAMLTHDMEEEKTGVVDIQDADPQIFPDFLRYLYTGSEEIVTSENVVKLYTAADKFRVDDLKKSCLSYMLENLSVDNFCDMLSLSLVHIEESLTDACSEFFFQNSLDILKTPKWLMFATKNPVEANELHIKYAEITTKIEN